MGTSLYVGGGQRVVRHRPHHQTWDGAGVTLYNHFTEFGLVRLSVDFLLGTVTTNVQAPQRPKGRREVLRKVETELKGETITGVLALVAPEFFDKLIGHAKVEDAYKYFSSTGAQPQRNVLTIMGL